jgi:hypothetical protein
MEKTVDNALLVALAGSLPVCKLIETIRAGGGMWYLPYHIRQKAKADAEATVIAAESHAKANMILAESQALAIDIEAREKARIAGRERRRQKNIEYIVDKTASILPESVSEQPVDDDWVARFFENSQDVSNEEMQNLWASLANKASLKRQRRDNTLRWRFRLVSFQNARRVLIPRCRSRRRLAPVRAAGSDGCSPSSPG